MSRGMHVKRLISAGTTESFAHVADAAQGREDWEE